MLLTNSTDSDCCCEKIQIGFCQEIGVIIRFRSHFEIKTVERAFTEAVAAEIAGNLRREAAAASLLPEVLTPELAAPLHDQRPTRSRNLRVSED